MRESTLVVWGGELAGRPTVELPRPAPTPARSMAVINNHYGFSMWMAGGGVRGRVTSRRHRRNRLLRRQKTPSMVHDLHADDPGTCSASSTPSSLPLRRARFPLTDVHGVVVPELMA